MLRGFKKTLAATICKLRRRPRPIRRIEPFIGGLEPRMLLSAKVTDTPSVNTIHHDEAAAHQHETPTDAKSGSNKQVKFINSLYKKYIHRAPTAAELSFGLQQL